MSSASEEHGLAAEEVRELSAKCIEAKSKAYCPYSKFRVGCTLLLNGPPWHVSGANVENAAYPVGTCAERVAVGTAVATHSVTRRRSTTASETSQSLHIRAVAVVTDLPDVKASPCGMCRQFLREFCTDDTPVFLHDARGEYKLTSMGELLPFSFGPETLPSAEEMERVRERAGNER